MNTLLTRFLVVAMLLVASISFSTHAFAASPHKKVYRTGAVVNVLPRSHRVVSVRGSRYFYAGGRFYRRSGNRYAVVVAPIGAVVPVLPAGFVAVGIGPRRYFHLGGVYYRKADQGYVVIEKPEEASTEATDAESIQLVIYPAAGQSDDQKARDRYECHLWANEQTGFDPTMPGSNPSMQNDYQRAMSACLEGRQYVVR